MEQAHHVVGLCQNFLYFYLSMVCVFELVTFLVGTETICSKMVIIWKLGLQ